MNKQINSTVDLKLNESHFTSSKLDNPYVHSNHFMKIFFQSLVYFFII